MTDDELRTLVREAIGRQLRPQLHGMPVVETWGAHASHGLLPLARGSDGDGACLIEPSVRCNHCGHCVSYGH
jgi:hypothetical protein